MAVVAVTADVNRIAVATIATDTGTWGNDGGGGGVADEPDLVYQGGTAQSRKVSTSRIGRSYTHGSGTSMTAARRRHYIAKINVTNFSALLARTAPAAGIKIGSSSSAYYEYYVFGNDNYPTRGGFQILPISPNVAGYRDNTAGGGPTLTSILYWSLISDFSATSKSENLIIDAIDIGLGLGLVGGDGADTDGVFNDFVSFDEGTSGNRYGFVYTEGGVLFATGQLGIGQTGDTQTSTATVFDDSGVTVVWTNGLVETGFHRLLLDLATSGTTIAMTNCSLASQGQIDNDGDRSYTTTEDSRPIFEVTGSTGTLTLTSCVIDNFASFTLNSSCTLTNCVITDSGQVDAGTGADLAGTSITGSTVAADGSALLWNNANDPNGELDNMTIAKGTNAHHAIELGTTSPTSITLTGITFTGFNASNNQNDSTIYVKRTSGTVNITIAGGGTTPSYKTDGATVNIISGAVDVTATVTTADGTPVSGSRVIVKASDGTGPFPFQETVTIVNSGTTATVTHTGHGMSSNDYVQIKGASLSENNGSFQITVSDANTYTYTMGSSPGSSPTGTIQATFVALFGTTDVNGQITTSRVYSTDQPVTGSARSATSSPYYKPGPINGTVDSANGATLSAVLILDE